MKGDATTYLTHSVSFVLLVGHDVEIAFHDLSEYFRLRLGFLSPGTHLSEILTKWFHTHLGAPLVNFALVKKHPHASISYLRAILLRFALKHVDAILHHGYT